MNFEFAQCRFADSEGLVERRRDFVIFPCVALSREKMEIKKSTKSVERMTRRGERSRVVRLSCPRIGVIGRKKNHSAAAVAREKSGKVNSLAIDTWI